MTKTVGILHPGAMGVAVAQTMVNSGIDVVWASNGRSPETQQRAAAAKLRDVGSLAAVCAASEVIISVCPPHAAEELAHTVIATGYSGIYVDANAISPQKAMRIGTAITATGGTFIDGSIIGGPPKERNRTWLYLSGPQAAQVPPLFAAGPFETELMDDQIGKASAIKMCFAANSKGTAALLTAILAAAEKMGVREPLIKQWARYDAEFSQNVEDRVVRVAHTKAWRFAGEMDEMFDTYGAAGLPNGFFEAAAEVYRKVGHLRHSNQTPSFNAVYDALNED